MIKLTRMMPEGEFANMRWTPVGPIWIASDSIEYLEAFICQGKAIGSYVHIRRPDCIHVQESPEEIVSIISG